MDLDPADEIIFGSDGSGAFSGLRLQSYSQIQFRPGIYLSGVNQADISTVYNLLNFLPLTRNAIGSYYATGANNVNISFPADRGDTVKEFETKDEDNKFRWSDVNGQNFPDLYSKRLREPLSALTPAPSFLQFQYENTMIIMTRNTINRFLMSGDPSTWAGDPNRLVKEQENYGLYAPQTLVTAGESVLWMSENGIIMWSQNGLQKISENVIKISLSAIANMSSFFQAIRNQYILHDFSTDFSYVYHLKYGVFYKFKALNFDRGLGRVLSGGTADENINLLISGTKTISKYPGDTDTTTEAFVKSKDFNHRWAEFLRWIVEFTGSADVTTHVTSNILQPELMPNQVDRDFSGASAWADVDLASSGGSYNETGSLSLEAVAIDKYCTCPVASMPMTAGVEYELFFDLALTNGDWILQDFTGVQEFGRATATGTSQKITFTPDAGITGGLRIVADAAYCLADFDNFSLKTKDQSDAKTGITSGVWNWITNGKALGAKISFTITGAKTIKYLIYKYLNRGTR